MENDKSMMYIVAIIAVVAVVALVIMTFKGGTSHTAVTSGNCIDPSNLKIGPELAKDLQSSSDQLGTDSSGQAFMQVNAYKRLQCLFTTDYGGGWVSFTIDYCSSGSGGVVLGHF